MPVHRWYLFPHSFTGELVHALCDEWELGANDMVLDPFAGSGTTVLATKEMGVGCDGYDLSPLAVLASNAKARTYSRERLGAVWRDLERALAERRPLRKVSGHAEIVRKALPEGRLEALEAIAQGVRKMECSEAEREFFRLALVAIVPKFSHAVADGGWLRWLNEGADAEEVTPAYGSRVQMMLSDVPSVAQDLDSGGERWRTQIADARSMPAADGIYSAVITSPPYPNRHDYTRIFGVELMFAFHDWEANRSLRYQSFHSHPEARPHRPEVEKYSPPAELGESTESLKDKRIQRMLKGYFLDMYLCLREVERVCRKGARIAFVVGNARYEGEHVLVDEFTAEMGERAGLMCTEIRAVRWRGNSAQQMGKYGRSAARESVVLFEKP